MNRKKLTKTFMMVQIEKNPFGLHVFYKNIQVKFYLVEGTQKCTPQEARLNKQW